MSNKILLVEDDPDIAKLVRMHVEQEGLELTHAPDGEAGLELALSKTFRAVILDWKLPKMDGLEVCRRIRERDKALPIIMLTSRDAEIDKILGLEIGADDYVTKPFSPRELLARIRAMLRRSSEMRESSSAVGDELSFGPLTINIAKHTVTKNGAELSLTAKEFDLLAYFASHPGRAFTRSQLLQAVWEYDADGYEPVVTTYINRLRTKIEDNSSAPVFVKTVQGLGYKFVEKAEFDGS